MDKQMRDKPRVPRLAKEYEACVGIAQTREHAERKALAAFEEKRKKVSLIDFYLDKARPTSYGGFEAVVYYLPEQYRRQLMELERKRIDDQPINVVVVDNTRNGKSVLNAISHDTSYCTKHVQYGDGVIIASIASGNNPVDIDIVLLHYEFALDLLAFMDNQGVTLPTAVYFPENLNKVGGYYDLGVSFVIKPVLTKEKILETLEAIVAGERGSLEKGTFVR